jgi:hypothetical protein
MLPFVAVQEVEGMEGGMGADVVQKKGAEERRYRRGGAEEVVRARGQNEGSLKVLRADVAGFCVAAFFEI